MSRLSKVFDKAKESTNQEIKEENKKSLNNESEKTRKQEIVNINFKVDVETRRKIKQYAAKHDKSLKEVFEAAIDFYIEHHP
jgi:hypothetical protein